MNEYGRLYPKKTANFGDSIEGLGRAEQDWFGFGFEPQRGLKKEGVPSTFNSFVDEIFNSYILPSILMDDFYKITSFLSEEEKVSMFLPIFNDKAKAKDFVLALKLNPYKKHFLKTYNNLEEVKTLSERFTAENSHLTTAARQGMSAVQFRNYKLGQKSDEKIIQDQSIPIQLPHGERVSIPRIKFVELLKNIPFRKAVREYYQSHPELIEQKTEQMLALWKSVGLACPYFDDKYPFLSCDMVEAIKYAEAFNDVDPIAK